MNGDMNGRVIKGRYKLIDERGRGSFATVYVARDTENNHIYAVKVMHLELSNDGELLARFQREAHIHLNLSDPHIVRIVDYGNDNQMYYIVMEYIDGQNLKYHMITHGPMEPLRALNYTRQIAEGLDAANKQGVVHRDIKPQNILINGKDVVNWRAAEKPSLLHNPTYLWAQPTTYRQNRRKVGVQRTSAPISIRLQLFCLRC